MPDTFIRFDSVKKVYQAGEVDCGTAYSIAAVNSGQIDCPQPQSLYEMQQESFTESLNQSLDTWYSANPTVEKFSFIYSTASFPQVTQSIP